MRKELSCLREVFRDRAAEMPANAVLEKWIGKNGARHAMALFHVAPAALGHAPDFVRLTARIFRPVECELGALRGLLRGKRLATRDQRRLAVAAHDHLEEPVHAPLRHVTARMRVDEALGGSGTKAVRQRARRIVVSSERRGEAPARIGERADHHDRIERSQQCRTRTRILGSAARGIGRQIHGRVRPCRVLLALGDLPATDQ